MLKILYFLVLEMYPFKLIMDYNKAGIYFVCNLCLIIIILKFI